MAEMFYTFLPYHGSSFPLPKRQFFGARTNTDGSAIDTKPESLQSELFSICRSGSSLRRRVSRFRDATLHKEISQLSGQAHSTIAASEHLGLQFSFSAMTCLVELLWFADMGNFLFQSEEASPIHHTDLTCLTRNGVTQRPPEIWKRFLSQNDDQVENKSYLTRSVNICRKKDVTPHCSKQPPSGNPFGESLQQQQQKPQTKNKTGECLGSTTSKLRHAKSLSHLPVGCLSLRRIAPMLLTRNLNSSSHVAANGKRGGSSQLCNGSGNKLRDEARETIRLAAKDDELVEDIMKVVSIIQSSQSPAKKKTVLKNYYPKIYGIWTQQLLIETIREGYLAEFGYLLAIKPEMGSKLVAIRDAKGEVIDVVPLTFIIVDEARRRWAKNPSTLRLVLQLLTNIYNTDPTIFEATIGSACLVTSDNKPSGLKGSFHLLEFLNLVYGFTRFPTWFQQGLIQLLPLTIQMKYQTKLGGSANNHFIGEFPTPETLVRFQQSNRGTLAGMKHGFAKLLEPDLSRK